MGEEVKNCWEYHNESARLSRNCVVFKRKAGDPVFLAILNDLPFYKTC